MEGRSQWGAGRGISYAFASLAESAEAEGGLLKGLSIISYTASGSPLCSKTTP